MTIELSAIMMFTLSVVAFIAGFISSIAGAGGLITLPLLLWVGLPPMNALATNKVQSALGTLSSTFNFFRKGHLNLRDLRWSIALALIGAVCGTLLVQRVGNEILVSLIPALLIIIALYFLFSPQMPDDSRSVRLSPQWFSLIVALPMGFYGGFFGPGMGSIFPFLFVWFCSYNLPKATAHTKVMVLTINGTSALLFILYGDVLWELALYMSAAQVVGAYIGSNMVIHRGAAVVQPLLIVVTLILAIKLLFFG